MKRCSKCQKEKERSEFYKHPQTTDGLWGKCKECTKKDTQQYRQLNIDRIREYDRKRSRLLHRVLYRKQYKKTIKGKKAERKWRQSTKGKQASIRGRLKQIERFPERCAARILLNRAIRKGYIKRPTQCPVCQGKKQIIEGHHDDYCQPLIVKWFCRKCHKEYEKTMKNAKSRRNVR